MMPIGIKINGLIIEQYFLYPVITVLSAIAGFSIFLIIKRNTVSTICFTDCSTSDELCFSDQSAFGKFFKTNSSVSSQKYRIQQGQI